MNLKYIKENDKKDPIIVDRKTLVFFILVFIPFFIIFFISTLEMFNIKLWNNTESIPTIDFPSPNNPNVAYEPVIYLYPQKQENVKVELYFQGKIIASNPVYENKESGWNVIANPNGDLINLSDKKHYPYIFWEGRFYHTNFDLSNGFMIKGSDINSFLKLTLVKIGLNEKESNEFITYWLPKMKNNPYNFIHFAKKDYTNLATLNISPKPDSILRLFMIYKPLQSKITITPQLFTKFNRTGFSVIEWGGSEIF